ncbi:hypothetical protein POVCU2_0036850 [Plasmodium ovale curtisi]|uniref:Uncharacterized protein n=1 Tax=Plasmodium ovale curtisi TaxID=864141 RepID=A0A1A8X5Z7_PLAOA|nr:hypothetical protein POVCU2_0036850 [Plasmodium ovale curtisi]SBS99637.1 hypothetical protein POVCU1_054110 [Plasmodium ovale curtisi]
MCHLILLLCEHEGIFFLRCKEHITKYHGEGEKCLVIIANQDHRLDKKKCKALIRPSASEPTGSYHYPQGSFILHMHRVIWMHMEEVIPSGKHSVIKTMHNS